METGSKECSDNYIFFSYAHANADEAKAVIDSLRRTGYSIWYDDGVDPGVSWDDYIAERIECCRCFAAYVTEAYIGSANCIDEISYARDNGKEIVLIYAENAAMPKGLQMRLSSARVIRVSEYQNSTAFYEDLSDIEGVRTCRTGHVVPDVPPRPEKHRRRRSAKRASERKIPVMPVILIVLLIASFFSVYKIMEAEDTSTGSRCTIGEMHFDLPDGSYEKETSREKTFDNYENLMIPARSRGEEVLKSEDYIDLQWYNGQDNKFVLVSAQAAFFSNDEFDDAVEAIMLDKIGTYKQFRVGTVNGRYGVVRIEEFTNTNIQCLNNGIFYTISFLNTELEDDEINAVIDSIDFEAELKGQEVYCGDISLTIPGNYYAVEEDWNGTELDPHAYMIRTDKTREVLVFYSDTASHGSASELTGVYADLYKADITESDESFGKCHYIDLVKADSGTDYPEIIALFEISGKIYTVEFLSDKRDITIDDIKKIVSTVEVHE